jgi:hypothetical protein
MNICSTTAHSAQPETLAAVAAMWFDVVLVAAVVGCGASSSCG